MSALSSSCRPVIVFVVYSEASFIVVFTVSSPSLCLVVLVLAFLSLLLLDVFCFLIVLSFCKCVNISHSGGLLPFLDQDGKQSISFFLLHFLTSNRTIVNVTIFLFIFSF